MQKIRLTPAERCWAGIVIYVLAADIYLWKHDCDTMSKQFGCWIQSPKAKQLCAAGTFLIVAHLWWGVPLPGQKYLKKLAIKGKTCEEV